MTDTAVPANTFIEKWVKEMAAMCQPDDVFWCDGSEAERERLTESAVKCGDLMPLNQKKLPGCYLHRSALNDVARTENLTFVCTQQQEEAGPNNNWMAPAESYDKLGKIFSGSMRGRTMYVIPFLMGPQGSPFSKVGIQVTDSIYVVLNMRIMTRMGKVALDHLGNSDDFTRCLHSKADLDIERRFICHYPQDNTIWSVGSGYGGNALLAKKCLALRIASKLGQQEGWLAEHMLIVGKDGRLWAVNPEAGCFGVAPGTGSNTNRNAMRMVTRDTIFTNVALRPDGTVWWEGHDDPVPYNAQDWRGKPWDPEGGHPAAHPNARFTVSIKQCPSYSSEWEKPEGVPISAMLFGARRQKMIPLVYQSFNWQHGTFLGATLASETTAAATGAVGVVRRDPMAMLPFCGYNMGDYWGHWLAIAKRATNPPKIFRVNWFQRNERGRFLWPGFGENLRVLRWIVERCKGGGEASETPIGYVPKASSLSGEGIEISKADVDQLVAVDREAWKNNLKSQSDFFDTFGDHLPAGIKEEHKALAGRLNS